MNALGFLDFQHVYSKLKLPFTIQLLCSMSFGYFLMLLRCLECGSEECKHNFDGVRRLPGEYVNMLAC